MPATPAWPHASLPRLYVPEPLKAGTHIALSGGPANYLANVLRLRAGDQAKVFDDETGEWLATVAEAGRRSVMLAVGEHLRERERVPDLWLLFAPIKRGRIDWLVEKATELGVDRLIPVITARTVVDRLNLDRLRAHAIEAAEQCDRTALPRLDAPARLKTALESWYEGRALYFADEAGGAPMIEVARPGPAAILIGPEGGFTDEERALIRAHPAACAITLGPRILRADTAALAAISQWLAVAGDFTTREK
ncbi:16S rRNA (uracil(1498)-N(3))-methyltransferase [Sphingosinicella sp.]|uniref:16S rRNA (uracil(1498)-N(3))-methyltransferase n=1 Tax=Sphingosinicella sp. TaxID=1917971 RepID=UPI00403795FF